MGLFRKKPAVVEAVQLTPSTVREAVRLLRGSGAMFTVNSCYIEATITTRDGEMVATKGDWLVKDATGAVYPYKQDTFAATYEAVK
jgi:hypothetical protein